jgi:hypothetical protein
MLGIELPSSAVAVTRYSTRIFEWPSFRRSLSEAEREMVTDLA